KYIFAPAKPMIPEIPSRGGIPGLSVFEHLLRAKWVSQLRSQHPPDRCFQLCGLKPKRPRLALVGDPSLSVDHVHAIWPARVGAFCGVAKFVENRGYLYPEFPNAGSGNESAFFFVLRTGKNH